MATANTEDMLVSAPLRGEFYVPGWIQKVQVQPRGSMLLGTGDRFRLLQLDVPERGMQQILLVTYVPFKTVTDEMKARQVGLCRLHPERALYSFVEGESRPEKDHLARIRECETWTEEFNRWMLGQELSESTASTTHKRLCRDIECPSPFRLVQAYA